MNRHRILLVVIERQKGKEGAMPLILAQRGLVRDSSITQLSGWHPETLQAAAELLTLRRDAIRLIDGTGPTIEVREPGPEPESATQAEPAVEPAPNPPRRERRKKHSEEPAQGGEMHVPVPSPDESGARSVPSDGRSPTKPKRKR